ncbi:MAG: PAS domain S-box protein, partial [Candidatus Woesearchaeota archaeon]
MGEPNFDKFIDFLPLPLIFFDKDLNLTKINRAALALLPNKVKKESLLGKNFRDSYLCSSEKEYQKYARLFQGKDHLIEEKRIHPLFGKRELEITAARIGSEGCLIITEITERRKVKEALKVSEKKYKDLAENIKQGLHSTQQGCFTNVNNAMCKIFGYSEPELIGMPAWELAEDKERIKQIFFQKSADKDWGPIRIECKRKDGSPLLVEVNIEGGDREQVYGFVTDITEREKAEEKIKKSEDNYRETLKSVDAVIYSFTPDFQVTLVSEKIEEFGFTPKQFYEDKQMWLKMMHPEDAKEQQKIFFDFIKGEKKKLEREYRIITDKDVHWVKDTLVKVVGDRGKVLNYYGSLIDITEKKKAELALKASEEKFKTLFKSSRDAIMTLSPPSWNFTAGNPSTIKMFNCKDEQDFISYSPFELSPEFQPDGKPSKEKAGEMINEAVKEGSNLFEWTHKRTDGSEFPATVLLTRVELEPGQPSLQATVRDITEQKKMQEQLEKYAKRLEIKINKMEKKKQQLNDKERLVLYGLV